MAWGTLRQHSTGASWHNSPSTVHDDRILSFLPSFRIHKQQNKQHKGGNQRGGQSSRVLHRPRQPVTRHQTAPTSAKLPANRPYPARSIYDDDPAFSADPRSHPHFHDQTRNYHPGPHPRRPTTATGKQAREPVVYNHAAEDLSDEIMDDAPYALLTRPYPPPQSSSHSSESTNASVSIMFNNTPTSSDHTPPSSNDHSSVPVKHSTSGPVNRAPSPTMDPGALLPNPPPSYQESIIDDSEHKQQPPATTRGVSAPELYHAPPIPAQLPRALTAPIHDAATLQRRETSAVRNPPRARELDRIDELDETDPFGSAIHHKGPYEAINAILGGGANGGMKANEPYGSTLGIHKPSRSKKQQVQFPGSTYATAPYALHLEPGQILPRKATLSEPRKLEQTPYHRQHHYSISNPDTFTYQPLPEARRGRSERQPPHPKYFPQQRQQEHVLPLAGQRQWENTPTHSVDRYEQPPTPPPKSQTLRQPPRHHSVQGYPQSQNQPWQQQSQHRSRPQSEPQQPSQPQPPPLASRMESWSPDHSPLPNTQTQHEPHPRYYPEPEQQNYSQPQPPPQSQHRHRPQSEPQQPSQLQPPPLATRMESWSPDHSPLPNTQTQREPRSRYYTQSEEQNDPQTQPRNQAKPPPPHRHRHQSEPPQPSQLQPPPLTTRTESWSPDHLPPQTSNHSHHSSRYDNQQGPVPLHVPKHLVMPSPLHQPNAPLPPRSHPEPQYPQQQQQHPPRQLRPTPSEVQFHDPNFVPSTTIPPSRHNHNHRAEDISMLPDGRKLVRKKTAAPNPIPPSRTPIPSRAPSSVGVPAAPYRLPGKGKYSSQAQEMKGRDKAGRRLSKRRSDI